MRLEEQIASFDLCMKLKELGFNEDSYHYWNTINDRIHDVKVVFAFPDAICHCNAYTASELIDFIPDCLERKDAKNEEEKFYKFKISKETIVKDYNKDEKKIITNKIYCIRYYPETAKFEMDESNDKAVLILGPILFKTIYDENLANTLAKTLIYLIENKFINIQEE